VIRPAPRRSATQLFAERICTIGKHGRPPGVSTTSFGLPSFSVHATTASIRRCKGNRCTRPLRRRRMSPDPARSGMRRIGTAPQDRDWRYRACRTQSNLPADGGERRGESQIIAVVGNVRTVEFPAQHLNVVPSGHLAGALSNAFDHVDVSKVQRVEALDDMTIGALWIAVQTRIIDRTDGREPNADTPGPQAPTTACTTSSRKRAASSASHHRHRCDGWCYRAGIARSGSRWRREFRRRRSLRQAHYARRCHMLDDLGDLCDFERTRRDASLKSVAVNAVAWGEWRTAPRAGIIWLQRGMRDAPDVPELQEYAT